MKREYENIGSFVVTGGKIRVTDPCYNKEVWCAGVLKNCVPGRYDAYIARQDEGDWGIRVAMLVIKHEDCAAKIEEADKVFADEDGCVHASYLWKNSGIDVGVDSGQCGFFDEDNVFTDLAVEGMPAAISDYGSSFYDHCCDITLTEKSAGVITHGCVSSSGLGDGGYCCYYRRNEFGQVNMACILYL